MVFYEDSGCSDDMQQQPLRSCAQPSLIQWATTPRLVTWPDDIAASNGSRWACMVTHDLPKSQQLWTTALITCNVTSVSLNVSAWHPQLGRAPMRRPRQPIRPQSRYHHRGFSDGRADHLAQSTDPRNGENAVDIVLFRRPCSRRSSVG